MFTFLPENYKASVQKIYRTRVWFVACSLAVVLCAFAIVFLLPTYVSLSSKQTAATLETKGATQNAIASGSVEVEEKMKDLRHKLAYFDQTTGSKTIVSMLERILSKRSMGIIITGFDFTRSDKDGIGSISVSGTALTREQLVAFSKALESEASFKNVAFPVASLAKSRNIAFTISFGSSF